MWKPGKNLVNRISEISDGSNQIIYEIRRITCAILSLISKGGGERCRNFNHLIVWNFFIKWQRSFQKLIDIQPIYPNYILKKRSLDKDIEQRSIKPILPNFAYQSRNKRQSAIRNYRSWIQRRALIIERSISNLLNRAVFRRGKINLDDLFLLGYASHESEEEKPVHLPLNYSASKRWLSVAPSPRALRIFNDRRPPTPE